MSAELSAVPTEELYERAGIKVVPLSKEIGAEVRGLDLSGRIDRPTFEAIYRAWLDHLVLVFRRQTLDPEALIAFSSRFGELDPAPVMASGRMFVDGYPEVFVVSNVIEKGHRIGSLGACELAWHTDMAYAGEPPKASCSYALEVPKLGGDTGFLNMYAVWEKLPKLLKERLAGRRIKHDAVYTLDGYLREGSGRTLEQAKARGCFDVRKLPGPWHPAVRVHPETGREALYIGRRQNTYIEGLDVEESDAVLDILWKHVCKFGKRTWHHRWKRGDVVVWDNRCTMHRRDAFPRSARRIMHRTQMHGSRPT